ncbi:MAG: GIY-YIG nuclease family protein [Pirellulaceae bacterium]
MTKGERRYCVYVVRLKKSVWRRKRFRQANPQYESGKPMVYVGSTGNTPEQRLAKHKAGGRGSNDYVRRYGKGLFEWAYEGLPTFPDRESAEKLEAERAEELKSWGWAVWYNADPVKIAQPDG